MQASRINTIRSVFIRENLWLLIEEQAACNRIRAGAAGIRYSDTNVSLQPPDEIPPRAESVNITRVEYSISSSIEHFYFLRPPVVLIPVEAVDRYAMLLPAPGWIA